MLEPKVSIVIPAFNVGKTINKCLNSLLNQKYSNLEVIIINDGSQDNTGKKCEIFCREHSNYFLINQENHGVSYSRNQGILHSTGDYVCFVDADDWLPENAIANLVYATVEAKADYCCGNLTIINPLFTRLSNDVPDKKTYMQMGGYRVNY